MVSAYAASAVAEVARAARRRAPSAPSPPRDPGRRRRRARRSRPGRGPWSRSRRRAISARPARWILTQPGSLRHSAGLATTSLPGGRRRRLPAPARPTARRCAAATRLPRVSPVDISAPTYPLASTGRSGVDLVGECLHPTAELGFAALPGHGRDASSTRSAARSVSPAAKACSMAAAGVAVLLVPGAGPAVQLGSLHRELVEETGLQHVGEEMVVAVPPTLVVQRHQEEVVAVEQLEHRPAVGPAGDGVAQGSGHPGEDGGPEEEVVGRRRAGGARPPRRGSRRRDGRRPRTRR